MFLTLRGFTLSGIVLMGVGIFVTFGTETRRASAQTGESGDTATVEYFSGTSRYRIAKKYNPGISNYSEQRNYSALTLMLFLPDFSPAADHLKELKQPGWRNQMTLLLEHGPHMIDSDAQIAWMTNWPRGVHTRPETAANGCDLYRTPLMAPATSTCAPRMATSWYFHVVENLTYHSHRARFTRMSAPISASSIITAQDTPMTLYRSTAGSRR